MSGAKHPADRRRAVLLGLIVVTALSVGQAGTLIAFARPPVDSPGPPSAGGVQSNDAPLEPDVTIAKTNAPDGAVLNGDPITYTLTVTNQGDASATGVEVTDQLPSGVTFVEATAGCSEACGVVTCALEDIGPGASLPVHVTVTVDEAFCGAIVNAADVSASNETSGSVGNNVSNDVTNTVECQEPTPPDLQVTKTSDAEEILQDGDAFLYTITVTNVGEQEATGVELVDVLPAGALYVGIPPFPTFAGEACTVTSSVLEPGGVPYTEVRCGPVSIGAGGSASVTVKVIVTGDVCGQVTNVVDVEGANEPSANVGPDDHAEVTDEIACVPRIRLQKGGPSLAHVGDTITYVFSVTNTGDVDLSNIDLSDPQCDIESPTSVDDGNGDDVLAIDEDWGFTCDHTIAASEGGTVHNQATVTGDHEGGTVTDTDTHDVDVMHPSVDLEETATPTSGSTGTSIVYAYAVTNTGDTPLFNVSVDDDQIGHVGDIPTLAAHATVELTSEIKLGSSPITNVAIAEGSDLLGAFVTDEDVATVTMVAGEGGGNGTGGGSPFTGSEAGVLAGWIAAFGALGSALLVTSRRRSDARR